MSKNNKGKLLHILLNKDTIDLVEKLLKSSGADSKAEVIRDALRLYNLLDGIAIDGCVKHITLALPRKKPSLGNHDN